MNTRLLNTLIQLKNAALCHHDFISIPYYPLICNVLSVLYVEGYVQSFNVSNKRIIIFLNSKSHKSNFHQLKVLYKSSNSPILRYIYICKLNEKNKTLILSTPYGFKTGQACKKLHIGGKLCFLF